ncbi:YccS family putative transporter [Deinococcus sp. Marseille-Q6407]|uniref:YccS family putative transporter n=1 Tax=Deinococcus sp. Marseille-Q6407 TaxID=2969223 RepID=UPI0021BE44B6|nr:YccS family putative transporter [Deinococcus sp. Marseille-Q6407]
MTNVKKPFPLPDPKLLDTLPMFVSISLATAAVWALHIPELAMPLMLGVIAGGLVDLDHRLTGRLTNVAFALLAFMVASLAAQLTLGNGLLFAAVMTALTFVSTLIGGAGTRYQTIAFGTLAVATYTSLTYTPEAPWYLHPLLILTGTLLYSSVTVVHQLLFPHRPVQLRLAAAYAALAGAFSAKAALFDPDAADDLPQRQLALARQNSAVTASFNGCRRALFYRVRGQRLHARTARMLRYYLAAQDMHERLSSAHFDYRELTAHLQHTDLIFRLGRLLELQGQACREVAVSLRHNTPYRAGPQLKRAMQGAADSFQRYSAAHPVGPSLPALQRLLGNLEGVNVQLEQLSVDPPAGAHAASGDVRIAAAEAEDLPVALLTLRRNLGLHSPVFRHAVRLSLVVAVSSLIAAIFHLKLGYWILLTALFVCQPNYSATKNRVGQRVAGTVLGVVVGSLVPFFASSLESQLLIIVVCTALFFILRSTRYGLSTFFVTIQALTSLSLAGLDLYAVMPLRVTDTVAGSVIAWLAVTLLWPDWRHLALDRTAARAFRSAADYLDQITEQLRSAGPQGEPLEYRVARRRAHEDAAQLSSALSDMSSEPRRYAGRLQSGFDLLQLDSTLLGYISALGAYRSRLGPGPDPARLADLLRPAGQLSDLLRRLGELDRPAFDAALARVQADLDRLRPADPADPSQVLWQQLALIAGLLEPAYQALQQASAPAQAPLGPGPAPLPG